MEAAKQEQGGGGGTIEINSMRERTGSESTREKEKWRKKWELTSYSYHNNSSDVTTIN
jgi:hypothetical protein